MSEQDYPVYARLSPQKLSQIVGPLFDGDCDPTDDIDNEWPNNQLSEGSEIEICRTCSSSDVEFISDSFYRCNDCGDVWGDDIDPVDPELGGED